MNVLMIDECFENFTGRVFPILGLNHTIKLRTNFGIDPNTPFKWKQQGDDDDDDPDTQKGKSIVKD